MLSKERAQREETQRLGRMRIPAAGAGTEAELGENSDRTRLEGRVQPDGQSSGVCIDPVVSGKIKDT